MGPNKKDIRDKKHVNDDMKNDQFIPKKSSEKKSDSKLSFGRKGKKKAGIINDLSKYKLLFDKSPIGIFFFDNDFKITDCNSFLAKVLNTEKRKIIGLDIRNLKDQSIYPSVYESLGGMSGTYKGLYHSTISNTVKSVSLKTEPLTDDEGNIIGGVGIALDISEKEKVEEALLLTENRYKTLSNLTTDAASILTIEPDGSFNRKWLNDKLILKTGYELHEIDTFEKWAKIVHPDDLKAYSESVKSIISGQKTSLDFRIIDKKGNIIWINNTVYPELNNEGKVVGLISAVKDITQRISAEHELKKQRNLLDLIIDNAPLGIWVTALDGTYPLINRYFKNAIGFDSGNISIKPEELECCLRSDRYAKSSSEPIISEEEVTFTDGKKHILQILKTSLQTQEGEDFGVLGIGTDVTDQKQYEKSLMLAITKAKEADNLKSAFLANMSHEIRTPLNGIIGFAKYLKDYPTPEDEYHNILDIICNSADHLLSIINDIIDISKLDAGQVKINSVSCNLNKLLDGVYSFFYANAFVPDKKDLNLRLSTSLPDHESTIMVDDVRLKQIFNNLISNAIKFSQRGQVEFGYSLIQDRTRLQFFVRDTGIGIPVEKQKIIFERFRQADDTTTREYGGTGLGLAISKSLVELMGGEMRVESKQGKGTVFFFSIPYKPVTDVSVDTPKDQSSKDFLNVFINKKVLIVEDDSNSFIFLKTLLENKKVKVLYAENGIQALDIVMNDKSIDLILMDLRLPVMNGYDAIKEIRKINQNIPIIAQTAHAFIEEKELCQKLGCNDFISKPIDPDALYSMVYNYLVNI